MKEDTKTNQAPVPFDFAAAVNIGKNQVIETNYNGIPVFVVPNEMKVETLSQLVDQQLERPYRLNQTVKLITADSFVDYYNRFATESSTIFVDDESSTFLAILDYHDTPKEPAWKGHKATYQFPKTKEWNNWLASNNQKMEQEEFALFIEDNMREIIEPDGAAMLEIASSLKATNNVDFKSAIRLDNGQVQFTYSETVNGQAGVTGQLNIPEKIKLIMSPFLQGAAYEIEARFRYRITPKGLMMWYTLIRPHIFVEDAFKDVCAAVSEKMEKGQLVHGVLAN